MTDWPDLVVPPGDPDELHTAGLQLHSLSDETSLLRTRLRSGAESLAGSWAGSAQQAFEHVAMRGDRGLLRLAEAHRRAAKALQDYSGHLREAQAKVKAARANLDWGWSSYQGALASAHSLEQAYAGLDGGAVEQGRREAEKIRRQAQHEWTHVETTHRKLAGHAIEALQSQAATARKELQSAAEDIQHESLHEFVDALGAPGLGFELMGLGMTTNAAANVARTLQALEAGNFTELMALDGDAYGPVAEAVAKYGPDSLEALDAWLGWQSGAFDRSLGELGHAVDGMGEIPASGFGAALDIVGKAGLVTGAVGDVLTMADGKSTGLERGMSGANLVGLGMAGLGTEAGAGAAALVGIDAVAGWVPVAGQVLIGATALYLAGDWAYHHWDGIKKTAGAAVHDVEKAGEWVGTQELHLAEGAAHVAEGAVHTAEHVASGAVHTAEHLASDLNPMHW